MDASNRLVEPINLVRNHTENNSLSNREVNTLLKPILKGFADVVYGSCFMNGNAHRALYLEYWIGNAVLTFYNNMFTNLNLMDMETGYKLFGRNIIQQIQLKEERFDFTPDVTAKIAKMKGARIYQVGISYYGRTYAEGNKIGWKDAVRNVFCIIKYELLIRRSSFIKSPVTLSNTFF